MSLMEVMPLFTLRVAMRLFSSRVISISPWILHGNMTPTSPYQRPVGIRIVGLNTMKVGSMLKIGKLGIMGVSKGYYVELLEGLKIRHHTRISISNGIKSTCASLFYIL
jgi:hypothetical protein